MLKEMRLVPAEEKADLGAYLMLLQHRQSQKSEEYLTN
jgi:hypothetical protein